MLESMAARTTTTVRVYPETRAEISRLAEAEGTTAAEFLEAVVARAAGKARLAEANAWYAEHPGEAEREAEAWADTLTDGLDAE
jgi:predicted transcriptional regulator